MSTPSYAELVAAVRREGATLAGVGRLGLDDPVPTCPGWTVGRLLLHVGRVYRHAAEILESRADAAPEYPARPAEGTEPIEYLLDGLDEVVTALGEVDADTSVWNWSQSPAVATFWARRMAHETLIHRIDLQLTHDVAVVVDVDQAVDAIDEVFEAVLPRLYERGRLDGLEGTLHLRATDAGVRWTAKLTPESAAVTRDGGGGDLALAGKASELLLLIYNRGDLGSVDVAGDPALIEAWRERVRF